MLRLTERIDEAEIDVRAPLPLHKVVDEVVWVRDGLANVVVNLRLRDGVGGAGAGRVLKRFALPLMPAPLSEGGALLPEVVGLPLSLVSQTEAKTQGNGFWLQGEQLGIVHGPVVTLPDTFQLRYTVYAAQLAGTAVGAGFSAEDVFVVRSRAGAVSTNAIALPTGSTLRTVLPPVGAGRLEGALRALRASADDIQSEVEVTVRLEDRVVFDSVLGEGVAIPLGTPSHPWVPVEASDDERVVEVEVRGAPGGLIAFEVPQWTRERSWKEGPNVLLVVVGGLRRDTLRTYGGLRGVTDSIDALGGQSLRFTDAWATSSWTLPSIATILTSTFGSEHLAVRHDRRLGRGVTTLAEVFRDQGYRTLAFTDGGFVSPWRGLDRGFDRFDASGGGAAEVVARAREALDVAGAGPWFALVHVADALPPYAPPDEAREEVELRHAEAVQQRAPDPSAYLDFGKARLAIEPDVASYLLDLYEEEVRAADAAIGELLDDLRERELFSDAVIALTSTHGQEFGDHGFLGDGDSLYPEVLRVPLFLKLPRGARSNLTEGAPVSLVDLAPTILHAAELRAELPKTTFAGVSLLSGVPPTPAYAEREHPVAGPVYAMRKGRHLVIQGRTAFHAGAPIQMFDVVVDPKARVDVRSSNPGLLQTTLADIQAHPEKHPPRVEGAEAALNATQLEACDPLPGARPSPVMQGGRAPGAPAQGRAGQAGQSRKNR